MAGSIQDRGNGSYFLTVSNGFDSKGKRVRKTRTIKAKGITEARKKLAAFVTEVEAGEYVAPSHIKFGNYVDIWRKDTIKKVSPKTMETYNYALTGRILPALSHLKMEVISHVHINHFIESLEEDELSTSYIKKYHNILSNIFKLAVRNETIKKNPMEKVDSPSVTYEPGQVYNSEELKKLYHLLNKDENRQQVLIIKMALLTGMRKGEILALQWDDVDFSTNTIHVRHSLSYTVQDGYLLKEPKTKGSNRKVAPPKGFMTELKKHILHKRQEKIGAAEMWDSSFGDLVFSTSGIDLKDKLTLFGKPLNLDSPNRWWKRFLDRVNGQLKKEDKLQIKRIRFHDFRHTAATDLINKGANIHSISKRLGHANITTTMNIYGHYLEEADQKIADMLDEDYI